MVAKNHVVFQGFIFRLINKLPFNRIVIGLLVFLAVILGKLLLSLVYGSPLNLIRGLIGIGCQSHWLMK